VVCACEVVMCVRGEVAGVCERRGGWCVCERRGACACARGGVQPNICIHTYRPWTTLSIGYFRR